MMETALEHVLISCHKSDIITYLHTHPEDFEGAVKLAVSNRQLYFWRATLLLWTGFKEI
jgi:hypothetical protein